MTFNPKLATFSFFIFMFGAVLTAMTVNTQSKLSVTCVSPKVQTGFNIILMLSIMMMIVPIVQLACHWGCGCPQTNLRYKFIIVCILLLLITAGSTVLSGLGDVSCKLDSAKSYITSLVISSCVFIVLIFVLYMYNIREGNVGSVSWEDSEI